MTPMQDSTLNLSLLLDANGKRGDLLRKAVLREDGFKLGALTGIVKDVFRETPTIFVPLHDDLPSRGVIKQDTWQFLRQDGLDFHQLVMRRVLFLSAIDPEEKTSKKKDIRWQLCLTCIYPSDETFLADISRHNNMQANKNNIDYFVQLNNRWLGQV